MTNGLPGRARLSEKGLEVHGKLQDMFNRQTMALRPDSVSEDDQRTANEILARLEGSGVAAKFSAAGLKASVVAAVSGFSERFF